jgi:hypothetical protein
MDESSHTLQETPGGIYVTEVVVPTSAYAGRTFRDVLPEPTYFGAVRGYYQINFESDHLGTKRSMGLLVTAQLTGVCREDAEDKSIALGEKLAELVALYTGSPVSPPFLRKLARVGLADGVFEQNTYFYLEDRERVGQIEIKPDQLRKLLTRFGNLDGLPLQQLELATRWYGISLTTTRDSLDSYLAAWFGLESIGPTLNNIYHKNGVKALCQLCNNAVGKDRDKKMAGIEHIMKKVAPEALQSRTLDDLKQVRNGIAHGLKPATELCSITDRLLPDLQVSLAIGILMSAGLSNEPAVLLSSFLPRDYEVRPDARATLQSDLELVAHQPYFGGWINVIREFLNERSRSKHDGGYVWGAGVRLRHELKALPGIEEHIKQEYVMFDRQGFVLSELEIEEPSIPVIRWRNYLEPLSWQRFRQPTQND